ncbi:histidine kinase [Gorillibacterium sp. CAU 1737]|uniref:sensor histidine kinase n=1 Tax=Gorillibacterium sp. CAU 1737 TaxID=3140362 RepID=UPI00326170B6
MPSSELGSLGNKVLLLLFLWVDAYERAGSGMNPWMILASLCYLALSLAAAILSKHPKAYRTLEMGSALFVLLCTFQMEEAFVLLFPISLWGIGGRANWHGAILLSACLVPLPFLSQDQVAVYVLAAGLTGLLQFSVRRYAQRLAKIEEEFELMKGQLDGVKRSLRENGELLRQSAYTVKLEERNRLSQQIHDDIGHSMAGALIQMEAAKRLLHHQVDQAGELLTNAISISKEGLERIRLTLKDVKPKPEELGYQRLRLFAEKVAAEHLIQTTVACSGEMSRVTPIQWKVIHENAMEAVTNSIRYSGASTIHLDIQVLNRFVKFVAVDNGRGTDKVVKGLGIIGMEERAATLGGTVTVNGTNGFTVTSLLPCTDRPA